MSRQISAKPDTCTEDRDVDPKGINVKVDAQYPGRSGGLPGAADIESCWDKRQKSAEGMVRGDAEGQNVKGRE
jgi:hypothetical protein